MTSYFHPLRRKLGVLTLLIACVFAGLWVRSFEFADHFGVFDVINQREYFLESANGRLLWYWQEPDANLGNTGPPYCGWVTEPLEDISPEHFIFADHSIVAFRWGFQWFNFGGDQFFSTKPTKLSGGIQLFFPYWFIVIPLTLLSAWLLLSKPRAKKPPAVST